MRRIPFAVLVIVILSAALLNGCRLQAPPEAPAIPDHGMGRV